MHLTVLLEIALNASEVRLARAKNKQRSKYWLPKLKIREETKTTKQRRLNKSPEELKIKSVPFQTQKHDQKIDNRLPDLLIKDWIWFY